MHVNTRPYGPLEVDERQKLHFPFGILGFEHLTEFVLLDATQQPFYWLQSLQDPQIAFVLISPDIFRPDYDPGVPAHELVEIGVNEGDDYLVLAIVTIPEDQERMTANLQGPIVINPRARIGRQSVSMDPRWGVRHVIRDEIARASGSASPAGTASC
jgi:flagellar assembly factor FliW